MKAMLPITDTHCHLDQYEMGPVLDGPTRVVAVTLAPSDYRAWLSSGTVSSKVHLAAGFFPESIRTLLPQLDSMMDCIKETRFIGEIGLDYVTKDEEERRHQRKAFDRILEAAASLQHRVLTIHSRRSARDVVERFEGGFPGTPILHWFSGGLKLAERVFDTCWFSVNTAMVRSEHGRAFIRELPRDRILLESDGPYIEIEGRPAQPRDLERVIQFFSGEWGMSLSDTAALIEANAQKALFHGLETPH